MDIPEQLNDLRDRGWAVAVHNDYRQNESFHTFWLFTKWVYAAKGEGLTDAMALERVQERTQTIDKIIEENRVAERQLQNIRGMAGESLGGHGFTPTELFCVALSLAGISVCPNWKPEEIMAKFNATPGTLKREK